MSDRRDRWSWALLHDRDSIPSLGSLYPIRRNPGTVALLILMGSVYLGQLYFAGSATPEAAYTTIEQLSSESYVALSPWLHSYHAHIVTNGLLFALLGSWTERRVGSVQFIVVVFSAGYVTNFAPFLMGFGGLGIGASGITNVLGTYFALLQFYQYICVLRENPTDYWLAVRRASLTLVGLVLVFKTISEFAGFIAPPPGTAVGSHILGVVLGLLWFIYHCSGLSVGEHRP